jgi:hypothetical protein
VVAEKIAEELGVVEKYKKGKGEKERQRRSREKNRKKMRNE